MKKITYLLAFVLTGSALAQEDCNLQYDGNGDGAVDVEDVLGVLSEFGEVCEPPSFVTCGDNISFDGYSYSTVLIGDQCWFAENLRAERYANGDSIPANLPDSEWSAEAGRVTVYGEGGSDCQDFTPDGEACNPDWSLDQYGRLYNWHAIADERGLCPSGWHVGSDQEWITLKSYINGQGEPSSTALRSSYGCADEQNGDDLYNFSGKPSGVRTQNGDFEGAGNAAYFWTSTEGVYGWQDVPVAWSRRLVPWHSEMNRDDLRMTIGMSVRCVQD